MYPNSTPNLPPPPLSVGADQRRQDEEQLKIIVILFWVFGGLNLLCGTFPLLHVFMGFMMVSGRFPPGPGQPPPAEIGYFFIVIGLAIILIAWVIGILLIVTGSRLRKRKNRTFCQVVAAIACLSFPVGTGLGVWTLVVLSRPSIIALFQEAG